MSDLSSTQLHYAIHDFQQARRQAAIQQVVARLTGQSIDLLSFEEVSRKLRLKGGSYLGLQDIPLDSIIGSVGRYSDFTRSFLPLRDSAQHRWARVGAATASMEGVPPIEVYKVGEAYFVLDGNHRVSVARQREATHIQAHITEFKTTVPLMADDNLDDLIIKAEYAHFLGRTNIDQIRPQADLQVTVPGRYWELETHIEAHCYLAGQNQGLSHKAAVADWYDHVYLPLIEIIREKGLLRDFPKRTETDLYLWIHKHQARVQEHLGWQIDPATALADLIAHQSQRPENIAARWEERLADSLTPDELESGPAPGVWREKWLTTRPPDRLFANILVPLSGVPDSWQALEQAVVIAKKRGGQLYGLHVVNSAEQMQSEAAHAVQTEFDQRCHVANIPGQMRIEIGKTARIIGERARWSDLVVLHLAHPPGKQPLAKLNSGLRTVIHRCPRPILIVSRQISPLKRALIAYDGSPKAREGLFVAVYLANYWETELVVTSVIEKTSDESVLTDAKTYLEARGVTATYIPTQGVVADTLLQTAETQQADLIIMGGYGSKSWVEVVLGSTVDQILRETQCPLLICR